MLREVLEGVGHKVTAAADCESGFSAFRLSPADLAIVDVVMPGKGGATTIGDLHQEFPELKIIAVADGDTSEARRRLTDRVDAGRRAQPEQADPPPRDARDRRRAARELTAQPFLETGAARTHRVCAPRVIGAFYGWRMKPQLNDVKRRSFTLPVPTLYAKSVFRPKCSLK
jgi:CheY-like chemotaxis protein